MRTRTTAVLGSAGPKSGHGSLDLSTTFRFDTVRGAAASVDALTDGESEATSPVYARLHAPDAARFEAHLARLERAEAAVAFSSGMAALAAVILAATAERGRHVVGVRPLYGGTDHLLSSGILATRVTWTEAAHVERALRRDTALVLLETPANPTLELIDIGDVVRRAGDVPVAVDSTFATPVLQRPLLHGAAYAVHSATKFLGGHGDALGGVVACSDERARALRRVRIVTGGILHPLAAYLLARGLRTLPVRLAAQQATAREIARRLEAHPDVREVLYPGLSGDPTDLRLLGRQQHGPGAVLAFRVRGGDRAADALVEGVSLIGRAVSLGSVDSLIQLPARLTHRSVPDTARERSGVPGDLVRLSVGLEDVEDLWSDLEAAVGAAARASRARGAPPLHPGAARGV